jgi:hypothetical protein
MKAVISGADGWVAIETFSENDRRGLDYENGEEDTEDFFQHIVNHSG